MVAGNLANHGYQHVKLLRKYGCDADLLIRKSTNISEDPKSFDCTMKEYPNWIKFYDTGKWNWKFNIISIMRKYDVIHASTELPIFAMLSGKPYVATTTGSDVTSFVHSNTIKGILLRGAYHKAKVLIYLAPYLYHSVEKLKIKNAIFLPVLWDYSQFHTRTDNSEDRKTLTIFHPTNHIWEVKRNDIFLKAFVRAAKNRNDIHLITINRGSDFRRSMQILDAPDVKGKITILPQTIAQKDLPEFYHKVDIVADQFASGSTGMIGQEAMACGKPLIQYVNQNLYDKFYGETPPIISGNTEQEIYDAIIKLANNRELIDNIGMKSREWLLKYHNHERIIKKYVYIYESIKEELNFQTIRDVLLSM